MKIKSYTELRRFSTFEERFAYLEFKGVIGEPTFGFDRWINQHFYASRQWKNTRRDVIARDIGCDLGVDGYEIHKQLLVHHMNPISADDIVNGTGWLLDPEFLITTCKRTHNAIHYGDAGLLPKKYIDRQPGDTNLW